MNINDVQRHVLSIISNWVRNEKTPIAQKKIVEIMSKETPVPQSTIKAAVRVLVKKGYIRKAITFQPGVSYVQLRSL